MFGLVSVVMYEENLLSLYFVLGFVDFVVNEIEVVFVLVEFMVWVGDDRGGC